MGFLSYCWKRSAAAINLLLEWHASWDSFELNIELWTLWEKEQFKDNYCYAILIVQRCISNMLPTELCSIFNNYLLTVCIVMFDWMFWFTLFCGVQCIWHYRHVLLPQTILVCVSGRKHIAVDPLHVNQSAFQLFIMSIMYIDYMTYSLCDRRISCIWALLLSFPDLASTI